MGVAPLCRGLSHAEGRSLPGILPDVLGRSELRHFYYFNFDIKGKLWKTNLYWAEKSESVKAFAEMSRGLNMPVALNHSIVDVQRDRGTIETFLGLGYPNIDLQHTTKLYDINRLEEVHR